jgi:hypothetical protein
MISGSGWDQTWNTEFQTSISSLEYSQMLEVYLIVQHKSKVVPLLAWTGLEGG